MTTPINLPFEILDLVMEIVRLPQRTAATAIQKVWRSQSATTMVQRSRALSAQSESAITILLPQILAPTSSTHPARCLRRALSAVRAISACSSPGASSGCVLAASRAQLGVARTAFDVLQKVACHRPREGQTGCSPKSAGLEWGHRRRLPAGGDLPARQLP